MSELEAIIRKSIKGIGPGFVVGVRGTPGEWLELLESRLLDAKGEPSRFNCELLAHFRTDVGIQYRRFCVDAKFTLPFPPFLGMFVELISHEPSPKIVGVSWQIETGKFLLDGECLLEDWNEYQMESLADDYKKAGFRVSRHVQ